MGLTRLIAVCLLLTSVFVQAAEITWQVKPSVCISKTVGAVCQFKIQVFTNNLPAGQYCLFLQTMLQRCLKQNQFPVTFEVELTAPTQLILQTANGQTLLSQTLSVKSLTTNQQRRRLRSPWSVF